MAVVVMIRVDTSLVVDVGAASVAVSVTTGSQGIVDMSTTAGPIMISTSSRVAWWGSLTGAWSTFENYFLLIISSSAYTEGRDLL